MKALKVLAIVLSAMFSYSAVSAQSVHHKMHRMRHHIVKHRMKQHKM